MTTPNQQMVQAILDEDFKFVSDIMIHSVDGTLMLGDKQLPYNVSKVFGEAEFVKNWLMSFALGNSLGINYFNSNEWFSFTNNGSKAVLIVDDTEKKEPLLIIRPLISHNLSQNEMVVLRKLNERLHSLSADTGNNSNPHASLSLALGVGDMLDDVKRLTLTNMIPNHFYEKHGINPLVEQKVYYTKDIINEGRASIEDINKLRPLLYKLEAGKKITNEEKSFIKQITQDSFIFNDSEDNDKTEVQEVEKIQKDPFSC